MRALATEAKSAREAVILDAAAVAFNRSGLAGANLVEIASQVGLSRAGLYTYFADREDMAARAYLRACALTAKDLERATLGAATGAGRLQAFLRLVLSLDRPPLAALSDIGALLPHQQAHVRSARAANLHALSAILQTGAVDGSLRSLDCELACQVVLGVLSWSSMAQRWTGEEGDAFAIRMAASIPDLLLNGVATRALTPMAAVPAPLSNLVPAYGAIDRANGEVLAWGSALFNQRGVEGVSLEDVAAEVGATKGLVYHRFRSKSAFVAACYDRAFALYDAIMTVAEHAPTGGEAARLALELNIQAQLSPTPPMSLSNGFDNLLETERETFVSRTRLLRARAAEHGRRGVRDGTLKPYDLEPVSLASAGIFSYLAKWPLSAGLSAPEIARQAADIFLYGIGHKDVGL